MKKPPRNGVLATGAAIAAVAIVSAFALNQPTQSISGQRVLATSVSSPSNADSADGDVITIVPVPPSSSSVAMPTSKSPTTAKPTTAPAARPEAAKPQVKEKAPPPATKQTAPKPSSGVTEDTSIANALFSMLNSERAQNHLPALKWSSQLVSSAHGHNLAMVSTNDFSHQVPGEAGLGPRISATGLHWTWVGENIAWSSVTSTSAAESLEASMYNEQAPDDGHRLNILTTNGTMVGIDVVTDKSGKMWITEDFGN